MLQSLISIIRELSMYVLDSDIVHILYSQTAYVIRAFFVWRRKYMCQSRELSRGEAVAGIVQAAEAGRQSKLTATLRHI